jgi:hypothetical protein
MFKNSDKSELNIKNFGAGSVIALGTVSYLVIAESSGSAAAVNLKTFEIDGTVEVTDPNHLTEKEARSLVLTAIPRAAFSDVELDAKGMKM